MTSAAAEALAADGHRSIAVACDVADDRQAADLAARTIAAFGRLDMAYAGILGPMCPWA